MCTGQTRIRHQASQGENRDATHRFLHTMKKNANDRRCLVVDDDTNIMRLVADMLTELGFEVDMAENGSKALQKIYDCRYDIVLSDLEMPLINGFLLAARIKSHCDDTRTVIMTGRCRAEVLGLMKPAIVDAWLFKPFNLGELCHALGDLETPESFKTAAI
jgi:DNA-binding response OmpR family regulator